MSVAWCDGPRVTVHSSKWRITRRKVRRMNEFHASMPSHYTDPPTDWYRQHSSSKLARVTWTKKWMNDCRWILLFAIQLYNVYTCTYTLFYYSSLLKYNYGLNKTIKRKNIKSGCWCCVFMNEYDDCCCRSPY